RDVVPAVNAAKQKGERVTMCWMLQELIDKGERRGEERLTTLLRRLMADGRSEAVQEAIGSEQARREYYREYGLID
ncbi:MAG: hypothetical protein NC489_25335, partial [Ruminococcus flavefaciens]|nr:hypothetical protein [Ruminococcus flavefaciens]